VEWEKFSQVTDFVGHAHGNRHHPDFVDANQQFDGLAGEGLLQGLGLDRQGFVEGDIARQGLIRAPRERKRSLPKHLADFECENLVGDIEGLEINDFTFHRMFLRASLVAEATKLLAVETTIRSGENRK
jgi:hypothetical protein